MLSRRSGSNDVGDCSSLGSMTYCFDRKALCYHGVCDHDVRLQNGCDG